MSEQSILQPGEPKERVLPTLNRDGTRRWLRPKRSAGRHWRRRIVFGWTLIAIFVALPYIEIGGKPAVLLDIVQREFTLFGTTFHATDTVYLLLFVVGALAGVFALSALVGRSWCGWACPQTVYMEHLFRPLETWIEGGRSRQERLDREGPDARRLIKYAVFLLLSLFLAHIFLAYFVGVQTLARWITQSPFEHPGAFLVMAAAALAVSFDFLYAREQICLVVCPYGRFQSALLDRQSLIVGYDTRRGEPRGRGLGKGTRPKDGAVAGPGAPVEAALPRGDCVDCKLCVTTCPTGIDIRNGLQMECIACAQCIDACDAVMTKIGRPRGLIRYSSQNELAGKKTRLLRPRVIAYMLVTCGMFGALLFTVSARQSAEVTLLHGTGAPYHVLASGAVSSQFRVKIANRDDVYRQYTMSLPAVAGLELVAPENPVGVAAGESSVATFFVTAPREFFHHGRATAALRVAGDDSFEDEVKLPLLGPFEGAPHESKQP